MSYSLRFKLVGKTRAKPFRFCRKSPNRKSTDFISIRTIKPTSLINIGVPMNMVNLDG